MSLEPPRPRRKIVTLVMTEQCNLRCAYCYESKGDRSAMPLDVAEAAIAAAFADDRFDEVEVDFFGGEPFLEFERVRAVAEALWARPQPKPYVCFAVTNGTLVHGAIRDWLAANAHRFVCCVSLDGTPAMHDRNRSNSFARIDADFFRTTWPDQPVKMTVSRATLPQLAAGVIHLQEWGFKVTCTYAFGTAWQAGDIDVFAEQLRVLCDHYLEHPDMAPCNIVAVGLRHLHAAARRGNYCGAGLGMVCVDRAGETYPCQTFLPISTGRSRAEMLSAFADLATEANDRNPGCSDCPILPVCQTCYGLNYIETGDVFRRDAFNCAFSKIRAKATAYLYAHMIGRRDRGYVALSDFDDGDLARTVRAVRTVAAMRLA